MHGHGRRTCGRAHMAHTASLHATPRDHAHPSARTSSLYALGALHASVRGVCGECCSLWARRTKRRSVARRGNVMRPTARSTRPTQSRRRTCSARRAELERLPRSPAARRPQSPHRCIRELLCQHTRGAMVSTGCGLWRRGPAIAHMAGACAPALMAGHAAGMRESMCAATQSKSARGAHVAYLAGSNPSWPRTCRRRRCRWR